MACNCGPNCCADCELTTNSPGVNIAGVTPCSPYAGVPPLLLFIACAAAPNAILPTAASPAAAPNLPNLGGTLVVTLEIFGSRYLLKLSTLPRADNICGLKDLNFSN